MPVVSNAVLDPGGTPVRVVVTIRLIAGDTGYEPGYAADGSVIAGTIRLVSDDDGEWSATLVSNEDIEPSDSYYEVLERVPGRNVAYQHFISVPDGAGPYELPDILVADPESPEALAIAVTQRGAANGVATLDSAGQVPLSQLGNAAGGVTLASTAPTTSAVADAAAVGVGTSAARSDHRHGRESFGAVTAQTSYSAASGNGSAATPARSDHTHGTPALPTAAEVGAAATAHVHAAADVTSGTLGIARIPTGSTSSTVALGDHTHAGGGASVLVVRKKRIEEVTNLTMPSTSGAWALQSGFSLAIPAVIGDYVELTWNFMWDVTGNNFLDWAIVVSGSIVTAMSSETATPKNEGSPWLYPGADAFDKSPGPWGVELVSGQVSGGNVTFQLAAKGTGSGTVYRSTDYPFLMLVKNYGQCDVA